LLLIALALTAFFIYRETETSAYQAHRLAKLAKELRWEVKSGPNGGLHLPQAGPYDIRLGYNRLPEFLQNLTERGFHVHAQARISPRMKELVEQGLNVPYREKSQTGLEIIDGNGQPLYRTVFPTRVYENFESVPPLVTNSLLFIENRELLDPAQPRKNPAIEWTRLGKAVLDKTIQFVRPEHDVPGGSTLATQIEKYRHSPHGMTLSPNDKIQQIASASVRAYLDGEDTMPARKRIVVDYLNTVPLAAVTGFGEANGLGDGLWAWYGLDFERTNRVLKTWSAGGTDLTETARYYKHVLSLMIAQRRPSSYLLGERKALNDLTNSHLRILAQAGVISPKLSEAAINVPLRFRYAAVPEETRNFSASKAANAVRVRLASQLGLQRLYELDRLDLSVQSTLDGELQKKTTDILRQLKNPEYARAAGLYGNRLLGDADPGKIIYSFTLSELTPQGAKFRIQADNFDQPLDINKGTKLDLGSTAKLRTLVTYLEIVETLHRKYAALEPEILHKEVSDPNDVLSRWAVEYLLQSPVKSLAAMLEAALERKYSANPDEQFFTGGGAHYFQNFKHEDDSRILSVREATLNSVNLVYIRLMRDIVRYHMLHIQGSSAKILKDADHPDREAYLRRFADKEGTEFINRFYLKYKGKTASEIDEIFFSSFRHTPRRLAAAYRYIHPEATPAQFNKFMTSHLPGLQESGEHVLHDQYQRYAPGKYSLADQGYIVTVHPLELWLVHYLSNHQNAKYKDVIKASGEERVAVYRWLFKTIHKNTQDIRIRSLLELEAFLEIHRSWKRLGYSFDALVPSLATAIGSSADRPAALAELMGIILNNGVRVPTMLIERLHFAAGTPFETIVERIPDRGEKMFSPDLAAVVRDVLTGVVEKGTASRLAHSIVKEDGTWIPIGGKTGTGDHRYVTFSSAGVIKESHAVNRSATFVFFIGDRFFGTLTAFVPGADAANYQFTSALSTQVLKYLLPTLKPLTDKAQPLPEQTSSKPIVKPSSAKEKGVDEAVDSSQQPALVDDQLP
jgi:membrane peptidoglycan carboxypeptidase